VLLIESTSIDNCQLTIKIIKNAQHRQQIIDPPKLWRIDVVTLSA